MDAASLIAEECDAVKAKLIDKNRKYGNSALEPCRVFSRSDELEQLRVRIDDKLSRVRSGQCDDDEDVTFDLIGYLILLRIAKRQSIIIPAYECERCGGVFHSTTKPRISICDVCIMTRAEWLPIRG